MTMLRPVDRSNALQPGATAFAVVRRESGEHTSVISVEGDLDLSTAPRLKWALVDSLEAGSSRLVVDLSLTTFIDSTSLGVLVNVNRNPGLSGPLAIVCQRENVLNVIEFAGVDGTFAIYPTLDEALADDREHAAPPH